MSFQRKQSKRIVNSLMLLKMINHIYQSDVQFSKAHVSDTEASFFFIYIYLYRMVLFRLKFMINEMILISILCIFHFWMVMFLVRFFWLVVLGLTALSDSISVYIGPSPREREKEKRSEK